MLFPVMIGTPVQCNLESLCLLSMELKSVILLANYVNGILKSIILSRGRKSEKFGKTLSQRIISCSGWINLTFTL